MKSFALSDVGELRDLNQDVVFLSDESIGALPNLYIVADGMGGEKAGDYASAHAVETMVQKVKASRSSKPVSVFEQAIQAANNLIYEESLKDPDKKGMGTTIVACSIIGDHLYVANVGDSRLYVAGTTKLTQITNDHSFVAELVRTGKLEAAEAKYDTRKNMITRAVGAESTVNVDYFDVTLQGNELILLCSDGLTNMVEDKDIYSVLSSSDNIKNKATRLVELANANGGKDNVSAIVVEHLS